MRRIKFLISLCLITLNLLAIPAKKGVIKVVTADSDTIGILLYGDENHSFRTTEDGYLIKEGSDGNYYYAELKNSVVTCTSIKVTDVELRSTEVNRELEKIGKCDFEKMTAVAKAKMENKRMSVPPVNRQKGVSKSAKATMTTGSKGLVILVSYSDLDFSTTKENISDLLNKKGYNYNGATGSAKDYFETASMNTYSPVFDVYGPYKLDNTRSYYGGNNSSGDDQNPAQMVVDACAKLAADATANVDFSDYDTNNDGYVDNIFIYYAGNNEAEGGPASSIWPHRWVVYPGYVTGQTRYNGVTIYDYACTSEFKGSYGSTRCGIGTFTHEFSHVLGLPDLYITDYGSNHKTLGSFDIMDAGGYNNGGNTPPTYSAYERFYVGWLTPVILNSPDEYKLNDLKTSNKAYLISSNGNHNLNGQDPNPSVFYLLENRQRTGWDAYLEAKGMMITKISYNSYTWYANTVNNDANSMGVNIIEAGGNKGYETSSDLFPGTANVTSYTPYNKYPITNISESNSIITFDFMGGKTCPFSVTFFAGNYGECDTLELTESSCEAGVILPHVTPLQNDIIFEGWSTNSDAQTADAGLPGALYHPDKASFLYAVYSQNGNILENDGLLCFSESFNKLSEPTHIEITEEINLYTDRKNWQGNKIYCSNGLIKVGNNAEKGELISPKLGMNANMELYIKGYSPLKSELSIYDENNKIVGKVLFNEEEEEKTTRINFIPIHSSIRFVCSQNVFFIDSISICGEFSQEPPVEVAVDEVFTENGKVQMYKKQGSDNALLTNVPDNAEIICYDILGHKIWQKRSTGNTMTVEIPQGMFIIQIIDEDNIQVIKGI